ncbi:kinase [Dorcoceras hygrometricum]|uniref:non-specific serine/threonine protein kinase n=1 Tax=Dorcoceras hygrometricum TaxID=472368 RepID=A0A2Z7BRC4_9LAMI|nr:kinase [Dorcoceras hygrometricum]
MKKPYNQLLVYFLTVFLVIRATSATDFLFNGFGSSNVSLYGNATIQSRILTLTTDTAFSIGRALYPTKIATKRENSSYVLPFSTSFIFVMAPYEGVLPGHGIVFLFVPHTGIQGTSSSQNLGLFNFSNNGLPSNHVFGVEFDVFMNQEFHDINDNHVGIDVNSLTSVIAYEAGYWPDPSDGDSHSYSFKKLKLNNWKNYQVWIDHVDGIVNVTMAPVGVRRPKKPLLSVRINLSEIFEDQMFVGFTSATGALVESHKILAWSFSNTNFSLSEALITRDLPSFEPPKIPLRERKGFIAGTASGLFSFVFTCSLITYLVVRRNRRIRKEMEEMEDWEFEYWPHRIAYQVIDAATKRFSDENVIGVGGNGKVYKGVLPGGTVVAVKRFSLETGQGIRAFLAEISSLGRLKHRNLVGLRGWCKKEKGSLILVYDYMENGSLDKKLFDCEESKMLSCEDRLRILKQVASGILYLHEGWEAKVLHRDIKASNVLLDKEMNARLGDFGLARMQDHSKTASTTCVVGTVGYLAPEVVKSGRVSTQTDVFGYGVLILETICGRRPIEEGQPPLIEWMWELMSQGALLNGVDARLRNREGLDEKEVELMLHLGLWCTHPDSNSRPKMRQVAKILEGKNEFDESEGNDSDISLLQIMETKDWSLFPHAFGDGFSSHPTFEEIRQAMCSSLSSSWSNTFIEGR